MCRKSRLPAARTGSRSGRQYAGRRSIELSLKTTLRGLFLWRTTVNKKGYLLTSGTFLVLLLLSLVFYRSPGTLTASALQSGRPHDLPVANFEQETSNEKSQTRKQKDAHFNSHGKGFRAISELPVGS